MPSNITTLNKIFFQLLKKTPKEKNTLISTILQKIQFPSTFITLTLFCSYSNNNKANFSRNKVSKKKQFGAPYQILTG